MRLKLIIRDKEYRDALIEKIAESDMNIFAEVGNGTVSAGMQGELIVTDVSPENISDDVLKKICGKTVFLTPLPTGGGISDDGINRIFKYCGIKRMLSDISLIYHDVTGIPSARPGLAGVFAVCADADGFTEAECRMLARQIVFRKGGSVLIIPLGYVNSYGLTGEADKSRFMRLMYQIATGRDFNSDGYIETDSCGVSFLRLPRGLNPIAYLGEEELISLTDGMSVRFDTIILDAGACYRDGNLRLIREADNIVMIKGSRCVMSAEDIAAGDEAVYEKIREISISADTDYELAMDDYVRDLYGGEIEYDKQETDSN